MFPVEDVRYVVGDTFQEHGSSGFLSFLMRPR